MLNRHYVDGLRRAGVQMQPFSSVYQLHTLSYRSHRKLAIVDGRVGYSGGLNMTDKHLTGPKGFTGWRDTHSRVTGEAVTILQSVFATMWTNATGENLFDERYFPEAQASEGGVPIQVVSAGPDSRWETIRQAYLGTIALARDHVYLQSPFLILDTSVAEAMTTAALAGVDVRVMIAPGGGELSPAYRAGMTYAADMARRGSGLAVQGGLSSLEDHLRRLTDLFDRIGKYGHPQFFDQLRDEPRDLRRGGDTRARGGLPRRSRALCPVQCR